jgi:AcrR family transcriptional regulator
MTPKYKPTRAKSEEKKNIQFEKILEVGKQLFIEKGEAGFTMRILAERLGMSKNNLYHYVESKRELWIAIRNKFYYQFREENIEIIKNHRNGSNIELLMKLFEKFVEFAERDFGVFIMMYTFTSAPRSSKLGEIEQGYRPYRLLEGTIKLIDKTMESGEIGKKNPGLIAAFLYSLIFGAVYIDLNARTPNPLLENLRPDVTNISSSQFLDYVLKMIEKLLREDLL